MNKHSSSPKNKIVSTSSFFIQSRMQQFGTWRTPFGGSLFESFRNTLLVTENMTMMIGSTRTRWKHSTDGM